MPATKNPALIRFAGMASSYNACRADAGKNQSGTCCWPINAKVVICSTL